MPIGEGLSVLSAEEFLRWMQRVALSEAARATVEAIRAAKPARLVGGGRRNVIGRYPSRKMGVTVQFESNHVERAFLLEYVRDPDVLEFYWTILMVQYGTAMI